MMKIGKEIFAYSVKIHTQPPSPLHTISHFPHFQNFGEGECLKAMGRRGRGREGSFFLKKQSVDNLGVGVEMKRHTLVHTLLLCNNWM